MIATADARCAVAAGVVAVDMSNIPVQRCCGGSPADRKVHRGRELQRGGRGPVPPCQRTQLGDRHFDAVRDPPRSDSVRVEFTANQNHCADMIAHIFFDGRQWGSNVGHPGQADGGYEIPAKNGRHQIGVQAEGLPGGSKKARSPLGAVRSAFTN